MRCLVGFYGLNRSLRWTAPAIARNIVRPLSAAGIPTRYAAHFNEPRSINNLHSAERNLAVTRKGLETLQLDALLIEPQEELRLPTKLVQLIDHLPNGPRLEPRSTMINLLFQLHSLRRLWQLSHLTGDEFDVYLFIRPDLEYLDEIDVDEIRHSIFERSVDLITASWDQWGGLNDRFAFCSQRGAEVFANRIRDVERFCTENDYLHAEELLARAATWANLELGFTSLRGMRVRADGSTIREGFKLSTGQFARGVARKRLEKLRNVLKPLGGEALSHR